MFPPDTLFSGQAPEGAEERLARKVALLSMLGQVGQALHRTGDLEHILRMILVAVTAGQGLGFNRAFLLLADPAGRWLEGRLAIGPSSPEEAGRIWTEIRTRQLGLPELLEAYTRSVEGTDVRVTEVAGALRVPLGRSEHLLVRALAAGRAFQVRRDAQGAIHGAGEEVEGGELFDRLGVEAFAVAPLIGPGAPLGIILADNLITGAAIVEEQVAVLETFASQASTAIHEARLHRELEKKIEALRQVNALLKANQLKLLQAERLSALGEMASVLAHEVRTPLVVIGGFARSLMRQIEAGDPRGESVEIIVSEVNQLEQLVNNVLGFGRQARSRPSPGDLNQLVRRTADRLREECRLAGIEVRLELADDLPLLSLDRDQVSQVLNNVSLNAVHAMPGGGRLSLGTLLIPGGVRLEISDTGEGIPAERREQVFEPFFTTKGTGAGLGLTVAATIMKGHGGAISLASGGGQGTTFFLDFPLLQEGKERSDDAEEDPRRRGRKEPAAAL